MTRRGGNNYHNEYSNTPHGRTRRASAMGNELLLRVYTKQSRGGEEG